MLKRACALAVLLAASVAALTAQSPETERQIFRASLDLVSVAVVVRGSDGRLVSDLKARDFEVLDRGNTKPIVHFQPSGNNHARVALLLDGSGSMVVGAKRERSRIATDLLIAGFRDSDSASVFTFDKTVTRLTPFTRDAETLRTAVASVSPFGVTSIYDAIVGTINTVMNDAPRAQALLLLTDGIDTASVVSPVDAASAAAALDLPLYVLSVGDGGSTDDAQPKAAAPGEDGAAALTLSELANRTGGLAAEAATIAQLSTATRTILTELRHQYVLAIPAGTEKGWHNLTVRVRRGRLQARSRNGYVVT